MRGNITKRGKKSWQLKFDVAGQDSKRQTRYATVHGTYQDAQKELTRLLAASDVGALPDPNNMTITEYVTAWLSASTSRSPKTVERYHELAGGQIIPHLGAHKLQRLRPEHVQMWHGALLETGLAPRTIGHAHRLLRLVLGTAVRNGTLIKNAAAPVTPPRVEDREIEILSPEQIALVSANLRGHTLLPIVKLALATGMRRGELLGLQWGDVELDAGTLRVERSVEETALGTRLKPPKTKRGRRNIALPPHTVAMLRAQKVQQMELRFALGMGKPDDTTLVFSDIEGRVLKPHTVTRAWRRAVQRIGVETSFHALRHTHVSILIKAGVDILTISRRLGHSKAAITLDVYGHLIAGADEAAADAIAGVLK
jgi:integrase